MASGMASCLLFGKTLKGQRRKIWVGEIGSMLSNGANKMQNAPPCIVLCCIKGEIWFAATGDIVPRCSVMGHSPTLPPQNCRMKITQLFDMASKEVIQWQKSANVTETCVAAKKIVLIPGQHCLQTETTC